MNDKWNPIIISSGKYIFFSFLQKEFCKAYVCNNIIAYLNSNLYFLNAQTGQLSGSWDVRILSGKAQGSVPYVLLSITS